MAQQIKEIPASEFKMKCLNFMDQVNETRVPIIITKRGAPIVKLVPIKEESFDIFGCLKASVTINKDIIKPIEIDWEADEK